MAVLAYLRISTGKQELDNQKLAILNYANTHNIKINEFIEVQISTKKSYKDRRIDQVLEKLKKGDTLIISELSRLGRSIGQVIQIVDELINKKIKLIAIKENIILSGKKNIHTKVMITMIALFAEIERDLISERTKEALAIAKAKGKILGRPKGQLGKSRLDGKEEEIKILLSKKVTKSSIAKIFDISRTAMCSFIDSRKLESGLK